MPKQSYTPEYWMSLIEQHLRLGNLFALIPADNLPRDEAIALAVRLDVVLEKCDSDYIFWRKINKEMTDDAGEVSH